MDKGRKLLLDETAKSADPSKPAFLARPESAPVYHGFPVVQETNTDGWVYGAITGADPKRWGVYAVWFPRPIRSIEDLISDFRAVLPDLKAARANIKQGS